MFTKTLPLRAQKSLAILGKTNCLPAKTYLAGGSGLALHFGHRVSVDFDFFTPENFNQESLAKSLSEHGEFTITQIAPDTLLGSFEGTKFSIFRYSYPLIRKTTNWLGINIASVEDIGAMKIAAIMDRGSKKDFIDLFFLIKNKILLDDCLQFYNQKYNLLDKNLYSIVTSLSYFTDAEESKMPRMLIPVNWSEVKAFFQKEALRLAKSKLGI